MEVEEAVLLLVITGVQVGMDKQDPSYCPKRATVKEREIRGCTPGEVKGSAYRMPKHSGRKEDQGGNPECQEPQAWGTNMSEGEAQETEEFSEGQELCGSKVLIRRLPDGNAIDSISHFQTSNHLHPSMRPV